MPAKRRTVLGLALVSAAIAAACNTGGSQVNCSTFTPTTAVDMLDFAYAPPCVDATAGTTLEVSNDGQVIHTFTLKGTPVDLRVDPGASGTADLSEVAPGTYEIICTLHPQMVGQLRVR